MNIDYENYLEKSHNTRYNAVYNSSKPILKCQTYDIDETFTESFNPFEEINQEKKTSKKEDSIDKLFGWGKYNHVHKFLKQKTMTIKQQEVLDSLEDHQIASYLRDKRHKAFIIWGTEDIQQKAQELGFELTEDQCIEVIQDLKNNQDCNHGITWEHLETGISNLIEDYTFTIKDNKGENKKYCELTINERAESEFYNYESYTGFGKTLKQMKEFDKKDIVNK